MTRTQALATITLAGYHADQRTYLRTYVEHRISFTVARKAYEQGVRLRQAGMPCHCPCCKVDTGKGLIPQQEQGVSDGR